MADVSARGRGGAGRRSAGRGRAEAAGVRSVERAMHLLDVLGSDADGFRLADLAVHANLPPSTVHRLLTTMEQRGFVQFEKGSATWHIGGRLFAIGATFARRRNFVAAAMPILRGLRDGTRETANLAVDENGEVVLVAQVESREIIRVISPVGGRAPMTSDALGKAILSTYAEDEVARIIGLHGMHRRTDTTITRAGEMFEALRAIRSVGYAVDLGEHLSEVRCVAAPVLDAAGSAIAAISVSGLASRIPDARIADLGATVRNAARKLSAPMSE